MAEIDFALWDAVGGYAPTDRPMADVDLLVRPRDARPAAKLLESLGYAESNASWKERVFTPIDHRDPDGLGEHAGNDIKIELHERICERLPWRVTDISELIHPVEPLPGCHGYPSKASLMSHLVLHAAGGTAFQSLRLLHLHDLARLSASMTRADWEQFLDSRNCRQSSRPIVADTLYRSCKCRSRSD